MMLSHTPITLDAFRRLPGLYRRWELIEILRPGHYHLEDAGSMQDGTPLISVFVCEPTKLNFVLPAPTSQASGSATSWAQP